MRRGDYRVEETCCEIGTRQVKTQEKTRHPLENLVGIFLSINPERAPQAIPNLDLSHYECACFTKGEIDQ